MMSWLLDPKIFNYAILSLYIFATLRWGIEGKWADASYWFGAFWITATVTFFYKH